MAVTSKRHLWYVPPLKKEYNRRTRKNNINFKVLFMKRIKISNEFCRGAESELESPGVGGFDPESEFGV